MPPLPARNAAEGKSEASHGAHNATAEGVTAWRNDPSPQSSISSDSASNPASRCRCKGIVQHIGIGFPWLRCSHYQPAYGIVGHYVDSAGSAFRQMYEHLGPVAHTVLTAKVSEQHRHRVKHRGIAKSACKEIRRIRMHG